MPPTLSRLEALLAVGYPILAHSAVARGSIALTIAAIAILLAAVLLPVLAHGRAVAWLALPLLAGGLWWLSRSAHPVLPLYAAPVLVPAFLAWIFGQSLLPDRTPLIAQLIRALHPPEEDEPEPAVWRYARRLTLCWTLLFVALASLNLLLAALAEPDGLLLVSGTRPSLTVPQEWWSLFANFIGYLLVAAFFLIEYAYRRYRFPHQPYRNLADFLRRLLVAMPRLVRQTAAPTIGDKLPRNQRLLMQGSTYATTLSIDPQHPSLAGHFPGRPLVPGVVLLDHVLSAAERWLGRPLGTPALPQVKFTAPLLPGEDARVELRLDGDDLRFTLTRDGASVAVGTFRITAAGSVA